VTAKIFDFPGYFPKISLAQVLFHHIHACVLILDDLTMPNLYLHLLKSFPSHFSSERKPDRSTSGANAISARLSPRSSPGPYWYVSVQLVAICDAGECGHIFYVIIRFGGGRLYI